MLRDLCFTAGSSFNLKPRALRRVPRCSLASGQAGATESKTQDKASNRTYRVLPPNLPESERPPPPPRHKSVPWVGFFLEKIFGTHTENYEKRERLGPIYATNYFLGERVFLLDHAALIDVMKNPELFRSNGAFGPIEDLFGHDAMLVNDGDKHASLRSSVAPAFSPAMFPHYFSFVQRRVARTLEAFMEKVATSGVVKLQPEFPVCFTSVIIELTTGIDMDGEKSIKLRDLFSDVQVAIFSPQIGPAWKKGLRSRSEVIDIVSEVVRDYLVTQADVIERLREYGDDVSRQGMKDIRAGEVNVLLILIANSSLSTEPGADNDEEIIMALSRMMLNLWFGGYSTAAALSACIALELGLNDDVREKLIAEQDAIVAGANRDTTVTYEQTVSDMPLLESFMMEMLRLHPPISSMPRKVAQDVEILEYYIPKDTIILCDYQAAQRDPAMYHDPNTLDIERFAGNSKPPAMISFGTPGSPHYCVGAAMAKMMVKTTFGTLLRDYTYTLKPGQRTDYDSIPDHIPASGVLVDSFQRRQT